MSKQTLSDIVTAHAIALNSMSAAQYQTLVDNLDIKLYLTDFLNNAVAMHVIICFDKSEHMYSVLFVHIADDYSQYFIHVHEVTSSLVDAIHSMSEQLKIDFEHL